MRSKTVVKVGDVRRELPRMIKEHMYVYLTQPFRVVQIYPGDPSTHVEITALNGMRPRDKYLRDTERCPLWPTEHEEWKDAEGYEVPGELKC